MSNRASAVLLAGLVLLSSGAFAAAPCSNATLKGTVIGAFEATTPSGQTASMVMESWDGAGHIVGVETDSTGYQTTSHEVTGTYTISADCVASVSYSGTAGPAQYFINPNGTGYVGVNVQGVGTVAALRADLVSRDLIVDPSHPRRGPCSLASLRGTMAFEIEKTRAGVPLASDGQEVYDGAGNLTYQETDTDGYTTSSYPGTGTYTVTAQCVGSVYYDGGTTPQIFYIAPNGSAYWWVNSQNQGVAAAGKALRVAAPVPNP